MKLRHSGFTLLELLVVIAILGILLRLGVPSYAAFMQRMTMLQGVQQFARDVDKARNEAKRTNTCRAVAYVSATSYKITSYDTPNCSGTGTDQSKTMVTGTTLATVTTNTSMEFRPPYGTNLGTAASFKVASTVNPSFSRTLRLTGVMGNVVIQ